MKINDLWNMKYNKRVPEHVRYPFVLLDKRVNYTVWRKRADGLIAF
ncbi:hypothetical protein ACINKY_22260 [Paenibacillus illinoisensis]|uniref:Uncharacterized protein n=1 Tax=Paenibacillus illinoisensis TaxID=59845 RepID=A0ABW8HZN9_9BACL